ncbi:MAG: hypothetical protein WC483_06470, partial [Candidatus Paceibacterota bacterium]
MEEGPVPPGSVAHRGVGLSVSRAVGPVHIRPGRGLLGRTRGGRLLCRAHAQTVDDDRRHGARRRRDRPGASGRGTVRDAGGGGEQVAGDGGASAVRCRRVRGRHRWRTLAARLRHAVASERPRDVSSDRRRTGARFRRGSGAMDAASRHGRRDCLRVRPRPDLLKERGDRIHRRSGHARDPRAHLHRQVAAASLTVAYRRRSRSGRPDRRIARPVRAGRFSGHGGRTAGEDFHRRARLADRGCAEPSDAKPAARRRTGHDAVRHAPGGSRPRPLGLSVRAQYAAPGRRGDRIAWIHGLVAVHIF